MIDALRALKRIDDAGGSLLSAAESFDTSTSFGRFALRIMLLFGELELDRIRESWDAARASAVSRGIHVASRTPTGYDRAEDRRLIPNEDAPAVTEAFRQRATGGSWAVLRRVLEDAEVRTPYGASTWTTGSLGGVISNRVYLGEARSGEHVHVGAHEPLIDEATWTLAQSTPQAPSGPKGGALLAGLLRCAGCRYVLKADTVRARNGERLRMYRCREVKAAGRCPSPASVLGRLIEPWVVERFFDGLGDVMAEAVKRTEDVAVAREELLGAEAELDSYLSTSLASVIGEERFAAGVRSRQGAVDAARERLAGLGSGEDIPPASELRALWPDLSLDERRHLLSLGIDAILLRRAPRQGLSALDERALILWHGEGPDDFPGRGRRVEMRSFDWPG